jgi:hypothetical protein
MTRYNKREKSWTKTKEKRRSLFYKYKFWTEMFDIVKSKNIGLVLEIAKNKRTIEDLNKKLKEVNNNYRINIEIVNEWKELFYNQMEVAEEWEEKYLEEYIKK